LIKSQLKILIFSRIVIEGKIVTKCTKRHMGYVREIKLQLNYNTSFVMFMLLNR